MKRDTREIMIYAIVLAVALGASWMTWTSDNSIKQKNRVTILDFDSGDLASVEYRNGDDLVIQMTPKENSITGMPDIWLSVTRTLKKNGQATPYETRTNRFKGNKTAEDIVKSYTPFMASRDLGKPNSTKFEEYGFGKKLEGTLKLTAKKGSFKYLVGRKGFGGRNRYILDRKTNHAYLVDNIAFNGFKNSNIRLYSHNLHRFRGLRKIDRVEFSKDIKHYSLKRHDGDRKKTFFWTPVNDPQNKRVMFGNWMGKIERLRADKWIERLTDKNGKAIDPVHVFTINYIMDGKKKGYLEFLKITRNGKTEFYGRTELAGKMLISLSSVASEVMEDLDSVIEELDESTQADQPS